MCFDKRSKVLFKFEPDGPDWAEALAPCETPYELLPLDAGLVGWRSARISSTARSATSCASSTSTGCWSPA
jgi:hypothetical protein